MDKVVYLRQILLGLDNDPLWLYEKKFISLFHKKIKNSTINTYMDEICKELSVEEQIDVLCYMLSTDIDIFQPWYVKALKKILNDKHTKQSCYRRLKNIYDLYKKKFDNIEY